MASSPKSLDELNARIVACDRCPRLREHCTQVASVRRRAYADWEYWGRPVPSFGDPRARVLILGLAPGAHGSNRTGRPFTGDGSGDFLYPVLHEAGFASQPRAISRNDGMKLTDLWITSVGRCAPPGNKPTPEELRNCAPWLDEEMRLLKNLRVVVCLGRIAFDGLLAWAQRAGSDTIAVGLRICPWRGVHSAQRIGGHHQLPSIAAEHQHRQADAAHVSRGVSNVRANLAQLDAAPQITTRGRDHEKAFA